MDELPPPLPTIRWEPLLHGFLVLTAISRVVMIVLYFLFALVCSMELTTLFRRRPYHYVSLYLNDKVSLTVGLWGLTWLSILLAWLFFARHRMFRPLAIYYCFFPPLLLTSVGVHMTLFPDPHPVNTISDFQADLMGFSMIAAFIFWPLYYSFSPRVRRVFTWSPQAYSRIP